MMIVPFIFIFIGLVLVAVIIILLSNLKSVPRVDANFKTCKSFPLKENIKRYMACIVLLGVLFLGYFVFDKVMFETRDSFTYEEVETASAQIFKQNMGFKSLIGVNLWGKKSEDMTSKAYVFESADPSLLNPNNMYISSVGGFGDSYTHYEPTEITASFECLLYFDGKELPYGLIGILNYQMVGGMDVNTSTESFISVTEFEKLRLEVDIEGLSRRKAAEKLAEYWIEIHNYVKD